MLAVYTVLEGMRGLPRDKDRLERKRSRDRARTTREAGAERRFAAETLDHCVGKASVRSDRGRRKLRENALQRTQHVWRTLGGDLPDHAIVDLAVLVRQAMTLRDDLSPGYFRVGLDGGVRDLAAGFADDLDLTLDRRTKQRIVLVIVQRRSCR
jgi:hypothetical protein